MIFKLFLPSIQNKTLGKETLCQVSKIKHSAKSLFAEFFTEGFLLGTRQGSSLSVVKKTLGKEPNSGSDYTLVT
jgi:hypothetical protein